MEAIKKRILSKQITPFDIPSLNDSYIVEVLKEAILTKYSTVPPDVLRRIFAYTDTVKHSACIVAYICKVFDQFGSHSIQVYKALIITIECLETGSQPFFMAAKALTPEFLTVIYLSFRAKNIPLRDIIHKMALSIYNYLMYDEPLPNIGDYSNPAQVNQPEINYVKLKNPYDEGSSDNDYDFTSSSSTYDEDDEDSNTAPFQNYSAIPENDDLTQQQHLENQIPIQDPFQSARDAFLIQFEAIRPEVTKLVSKEAPVESDTETLEFKEFKRENELSSINNTIYDTSMDWC
ncbi:hypothetical protein TRFO_17062 [Tritrichomonas foetus]|uniref:Uncharacterized protein n=1 Tax=Tritrichomonas foetus TaxID=1144522 RepID=A0A1J4KPT9_9EUKA|nr:hypothetical protein TRFO_17062 [Tritrichomonas foetus]|eukprot:OHT12912.1 hypothetical protein TRFO_17062 [Tritrichomonas foetus]